MRDLIRDVVREAIEIARDEKLGELLLAWASRLEVVIDVKGTKIGLRVAGR